MDKIKIGEYVRTRDCKNLPSLIGKVISIDNDMLHLDCFEPSQVILADDIINHSKNIIDLIEEGDIVNNCIVLAVMEDMESNILRLETTPQLFDNGRSDYSIYNNEIKSVLTQEQYKRYGYEILN